MAIDDIVLEIGDSTLTEMYITPYSGVPLDMTYGVFLDDIPYSQIGTTSITSGDYIYSNRGIKTGGQL